MRTNIEPGKKGYREYLEKERAHLYNPPTPPEPEEEPEPKEKPATTAGSLTMLKYLFLIVTAPM